MIFYTSRITYHASRISVSNLKDITITTTIAIANQKGGVAKTTTCLSLGACLVELGHSVLLVDLDPQAHLTLSLGWQPEKLNRTVGGALLANITLVAASRESSIAGLDLAPANQELAVTEKLLAGQKGSEFYLRRRLGGLNPELYDYVLLDCPPAFGPLTLNALTAAQLLLLPVACEYYAVQSLYRTLRLARLAQQKTNPCLRWQVLVTMFNRRSRLGRTILAQMQQHLAALLCRTFIEVDVKLKESPVYAQPITRYAPQSRGAQQYRALAQELAPHPPLTLPLRPPLDDPRLGQEALQNR